MTPLQDLRLKKGNRGQEVATLQKLLARRGYPVATDGIFGLQTYRAVRAFQAQNLDQHGQPLVIDGIVGPLSWWSLNHPKPTIDAPSAVDYLKMPPPALGGSRLGRKALQSGINEIRAGAGEIGGDNRGPFVRKYLNGLGEEGNKSPKVQGFSYVLSRMDKLLGFGHVPD